MSNFITKSDYKYSMRTARLDQILEAADEDEELILDTAETEAVALLRKHLDSRYNMDVELAKSGAARHNVLLRWAKVLVIYFIYERIPDDMVPERVVKNYDDVMKALEKIEDGDGAIPGLTAITVSDPNDEGDTKPYTKRRWGSIKKRTNDGGSPRFLDR
jgi:hypothetical protein